MDRKKLEELNKMNNSMLEIESKIKAWQKSVRFLINPVCESDCGKEVLVCTGCLLFDKIKEMAITELTRQLKELQKEFEKY